MSAYVSQTRKNKNQNATENLHKQTNGQPAFQFAGNRTNNGAQKNLQEVVNNSSNVQQLRAYQMMADKSLQARHATQLQAMVNMPVNTHTTIGQNGNGLSETQKGSDTSGEFNTGTPIQRYALSQDGQFNVSENGHFAVSTGNYPGSLYVADDAPPLALAGGLVWEEQGTNNIDNTVFTEYAADISAYEENGVVGSEQHCGVFARGITNDNQSTSGEDRSTGAAGTVLKDSNTSAGLEEGWENHFAAVVKVDEGDHATFETAVGIPHTWVGIYGVNRGQTFKYKTQVANIERLAAMEPNILPGLGPRVKGFWDYLLCRPGRRGNLIVPRGITQEQAAIYQGELTAWRDNGTLPQTPFMITVVQRLIAELEQTGGQ